MRRILFIILIWTICFIWNKGEAFGSCGPPANLRVLEKLEPIYEELPGWQSSTTGARSFNDLPAEARAFNESVKVQYVSAY